MRMILSSIYTVNVQGIEDCGKADSFERCAVESTPLCYVWVLGFDYKKHILHDCYVIADLVLTIHDWMTRINPCHCI